MHCLASVLTILLVWEMSIFAGSPAASQSIRIGVLLPSDPAEAACMSRAARNALARIGPDAPRMELIFRGRPGQWGTEGDEAGALALDEAVEALITPADGAVAHQMLQIAGRTRLPVVSLSSDSSITGAGVPWAVRIVPTTREQATLIFRQCTETGGARLRWAGFVPEERAGREAADDLKAAAETVGCPLDEPIRIRPQPAEQGEQVSRLLRRNPGGIILWLDSRQAGEMARQIRMAGFAGTLAGPGWLRSPSFVAEAGAAAEGVMIAGLQRSAGSPSGDESGDPIVSGTTSSITDYGTDFMQEAILLLANLARTGDPQALYKVFPLTSPVNTGVGIIRFDRLGNRIADLQLLMCSSRDQKSGKAAELVPSRLPNFDWICYDPENPLDNHGRIDAHQLAGPKR